MEAKEFFAKIKDNYNALTKLKLVPFPSKKDFIFIPALTPGQEEISVDNVLCKLREAQKTYKSKFDEGRSILPLKEAAVVIQGPGDRFVIVDGHHHVYLSLFAGAVTVPVIIIDNWKKENPVGFWKRLQEERRVYLKESAELLAKTPPLLTEVKDNPNRYFASLIAAKAHLEYIGGKIEVLQVKGSANSAWVKINEGIPFIEFQIADVLSASKLKYNSQWGEEIPKEDAEKARTALVKAKLEGQGKILQDVILLGTRDTAKAIGEKDNRLIGLVEGFLQQNGLPLESLNGHFSALWSTRKKS